VVGSSAAVFWALLAFVVAMAGITAERWLFFAEANHVVNLYHGVQRT
jgi:DMSO reductase anchor subunit